MAREGILELGTEQQIDQKDKAQFILHTLKEKGFPRQMIKGPFHSFLGASCCDLKIRQSLRNVNRGYFL